MFKRSAGKPVLIADVGDASVGVCIAVPHDHSIKIVRSLRATLPIEDRTREQSAVAIAQLFEGLIQKILTADPEGSENTPLTVHIVMQSAWSRFRTTHSEEHFDDIRVISKDLIEQQTKKALAAPSDLDQAHILEAGVLQVFLNGYATDSPIGKRSQSVGVVAFESDIDAAIKTALTSVSGKYLPGREPRFYSGTRALLMVMHAQFPDISRFVLLDIGGTLTSCAVVRKDGVTQFTSISEGFSTLIKRVSPGGLPEEVLSLLRMLSTDTCSTTACQSIKDALAKAEPELVRVFGEAFAKLASQRKMPNACMIAGPTELTQWLAGFFSRIDFSQFTATTKPFLLETLSPDHMSDFVQWGNGVVPDAGVGISAASVNILGRYV
jgi:hypothetical protein